ncbi:helix-turn-helix domain-containing protein [Microbispora sp. H13382]|uniref:helix-turn-helix domain-containing protein n=1 Tax=Microbispora sp. H13382 TaxID=2729112 RepID=UPI0037CCB985
MGGGHGGASEAPAGDGPGGEALKAEVKRRYADGGVDSHAGDLDGRSYGFVHQPLEEAGALLRPWGGVRKCATTA